MDITKPSMLTALATGVLIFYVVVLRLIMPFVVLGYVDYSTDEMEWNVLCSIFAALGAWATWRLRKKGL